MWEGDFFTRVSNVDTVGGLERRDLGDLGVSELEPEEVKILLRVVLDRGGVGARADRHDRAALKHPPQAHLADPLAVDVRNLLERRSPFLPVAGPHGAVRLDSRQCVSVGGCGVSGWVRELVGGAGVRE